MRAKGVIGSRLKYMCKFVRVFKPRRSLKLVFTATNIHLKNLLYYIFFKVLERLELQNLKEGHVYAVVNLKKIEVQC